MEIKILVECETEHDYERRLFQQREEALQYISEVKSKFTYIIAANVKVYTEEEVDSVDGDDDLLEEDGKYILYDVYSGNDPFYILEYNKYLNICDEELDGEEKSYYR